MLNDDNDESRRAVEHCYRTQKTMVNPIVDWGEDDVWEFLNSNSIPHCCLYDEGFRRLGCIGCPMNTKRERDIQRWPKYKALYLAAFDKMLKERHQRGLESMWETAEDVMQWWLRS